MKWLSHGITAPIGFDAAGLFTGVKRKRKDLAMIKSERPCAYAGVFTKNIVQAAPVIWNRTLLSHKKNIQGIIINSGNANACTGKQGYEDTILMAKVFGEVAQISYDEVLVASTGVIGSLLPMTKITEGIRKIVPLANHSDEAADDAANAILTTDTFVKQKSIEIIIEGKPVRLAGMTKGSGMIHPNMGTMLAFITTDANISSELLNELLKNSVNDSFNMISVDGDTSTNDMVLVLANGMSETSELKKDSQGYQVFKEAFLALNQELAKLIIKDGEGATKFIEVTVKNIHDKKEARKMVHAIITSNLVKTAFFGEDANWGRILCALGYSGAEFDPNKVDLHYISESGTICLLEHGKPLAFDEEFALAILKEKEIKVIVNCNQGDEQATGWGCDLSYDYVKINGEYRT